MHRSFALVASCSVVLLFSGCLDQNFEQESLAKYQTTRASTFVGFAPLQNQQEEADIVPRRPARGMTMPTGRFSSPRFSSPGGGRFSFPRGGNFTFPKRDRFTFPDGGFAGGNGFSAPQGRNLRADRMTMPADSAINGGRFTWPQNNQQSYGQQPFNQNRGGNSGGFTQPSGRFTFPAERTGRFTYPSES